MLWGLPVIRNELVKLACTVLMMSPLQACTPGSFHLWDGFTNTISVSAPHHVLHVMHLAYLDEMQDASL
jgi:hypothetical protein